MPTPLAIRVKQPAGLPVLDRLDLPVQVRTPQGGHRDATMQEIDAVGQDMFAHVQWSEDGRDAGKWVAFDEDIIHVHN